MVGDLVDADVAVTHDEDWRHEADDECGDGVGQDLMVAALPVDRADDLGVVVDDPLHDGRGRRENERHDPSADGQEDGAAVGHDRRVAERVHDVDVAVDADEGQAEHGHDDEAVVEEAGDVTEKAAEDPAVEPDGHQRKRHDETSAPKVGDSKVDDEYIGDLTAEKGNTNLDEYRSKDNSHVV